MDYPYDAKTNKATVMIRLWAESIKLAKGRLLKIHHEDGPFGLASTTVSGADTFGSVPKDDYDPV